jgi:hypothetical protein
MAPNQAPEPVPVEPPDGRGTNDLGPAIGGHIAQAVSNRNSGSRARAYQGLPRRSPIGALLWTHPRHWKGYPEKETFR